MKKIQILGLTQNLSQTLLPLCPSYLRGLLFRDFFVSPKIIKSCKSSNPINPHATPPTS
jgi:hypothetical protein